MEFADNGDLYQKITNHKKTAIFFEENEIWKIFIQLVKGLKSLHELKILHRDLKSANVFLFSNGLSKLGDLNVSKVAKRGLSYTQTGTPYYASPEVWKDQPYNNKSDIWSLGCVLYEMITLRPPFRAENMEGLYNKVIKGVYGKIPERFSNDLSNVLKILLQVNPEFRPSCEQILKSSFVNKRVEFFKSFSNEDDFEDKVLLQTIKVPKNLVFLGDKLPPKNYEVKDEKKYRSFQNRNDLNNEDNVKNKNLNEIEEEDNNKNYITERKNEKDKKLIVNNNNSNNNSNNSNNNNKNNNCNKIYNINYNNINNRNKNKLKGNNLENGNSLTNVKILPNNNKILMKLPSINSNNNQNVYEIQNSIKNNLNKIQSNSERLLSIEEKLNSLRKKNNNNSKVLITPKNVEKYNNINKRNNSVEYKSELNDVIQNLEHSNSVLNVIPENKCSNKYLRLKPAIINNNYENINNFKFYKIYSPYFANQNYQQKVRKYYSPDRKIIRNGSSNNINVINNLEKYYEQYNIYRKKGYDIKYNKDYSMMEKRNIPVLNKRKLSPIKRKIINIC